MLDRLNYRYETIAVGSINVHIRSLWNLQEFQDHNNLALDLGVDESQWPLFGILWPSSFILATLMEKRQGLQELKILEVGCGLALSSLVLKLRGANVSATDYNPAAENFLKENIRINQCEEIPFSRANWIDYHLGSQERYDLIIGSDILYQGDHCNDLSHFINKSAKTNCEVIIVDPNRGYQNHFKKEMLKKDFSHSLNQGEFYDRDFKIFRGNIHVFKRS